MVSSTSRVHLSGSNVVVNITSTSDSRSWGGKQFEYFIFMNHYHHLVIARIEDPPHDGNKNPLQERTGGLLAPHLQFLTVCPPRHHQQQQACHQPCSGAGGPHPRHQLALLLYYLRVEFRLCIDLWPAVSVQAAWLGSRSRQYQYSVLPHRYLRRRQCKTLTQNKQRFVVK